MKTVDVIIKKPLYGTFVYIRSEVVEKAIKAKVMLSITIPQGTAVVDPVKWKEGSKRMQKVFKIPTRPMVLYGNSVPIEVPPVVSKKQQLKEEFEKDQQKLF